MKVEVTGISSIEDFSFAAHIGTWYGPYTFHIIIQPSQTPSAPITVWFAEFDTLEHILEFLEALHAKGLTGVHGQDVPLIVSKKGAFYRDRSFIDPTWELREEYMRHKEESRLWIEVYNYYVE